MRYWKKAAAIFALLFGGGVVASAQPPEPPQSRPLAEACSHLQVPDSCALLSLASRFMLMSYSTDEPGNAIGAFQALGYRAVYLRAHHSMFVRRPRLFLVARPGSNRVFVVFPGTQDSFDWIQNAKVWRYEDRPAEGSFYLPPGHAGFRRGILDLIHSDILRPGEFREHGLDCGGPVAARSQLTGFVCAEQVQRAPGDRIELVLIGHSRGAGFIQIGATAFHGLEWRGITVAGVPGWTVARADNWPYDVAAIFAYAPPYAIYRPVDPRVNQWALLRDFRLDERALMIIQDGDMVPVIWSPLNGRGASYNQGRHFGTYVRITRDRRAFVDVLPDWDIPYPHSSLEYCRAIQRALGDAAPCLEP